MRWIKWNTSIMILTKWLHLVSGYVFILVANVTTYYGIKLYQETYNPDESATYFGALNLALCLTIWFAAETVYQYFIRRQIPREKNEKFLRTLEDFYEGLAQGQKLVILDDMILDIGKYQFLHPGGMFTLSYNVGRDISKFYYGGYQL
jgi:hypothetical protein